MVWLYPRDVPCSAEAGEEREVSECRGCREVGNSSVYFSIFMSYFSTVDFYWLLWVYSAGRMECFNISDDRTILQTLLLIKLSISPWKLHIIGFLIKKIWKLLWETLEISTSPGVKFSNRSLNRLNDVNYDFMIWIWEPVEGNRAEWILTADLFTKCIHLRREELKELILEDGNVRNHKIFVNWKHSIL